MVSRRRNPNQDNLILEQQEGIVRAFLGLCFKGKNIRVIHPAVWPDGSDERPSELNADLSKGTAELDIHNDIFYLDINRLVPVSSGNEQRAQWTEFYPADCA